MAKKRPRNNHCLSADHRIQMDRMAQGLPPNKPDQFKSKKKVAKP